MTGVASRGRGGRLSQRQWATTPTESVRGTLSSINRILAECCKIACPLPRDVDLGSDTGSKVGDDPPLRGSFVAWPHLTLLIRLRTTDGEPLNE